MLSNDLAQLLDGKVDVLLRDALPSAPGLHLDHIDLQTASGSHLPATLLTMPGLAGCREHRALLKILRNA